MHLFAITKPTKNNFPPLRCDIWNLFVQERIVWEVTVMYSSSLCAVHQRNFQQMCLCSIKIYVCLHFFTLYPLATFCFGRHKEDIGLKLRFWEVIRKLFFKKLQILTSVTHVNWKLSLTRKVKWQVQAFSQWTKILLYPRYSHLFTAMYIGFRFARLW